MFRTLKASRNANHDNEEDDDDDDDDEQPYIEGHTSVKSVLSI